MVDLRLVQDFHGYGHDRWQVDVEMNVDDRSVRKMSILVSLLLPLLFGLCAAGSCR